MTHRFQAEIRTEHLRAMAHLAGQRDVRYYLNGVQVYATPEVFLAATDGNAVGLLRTGQQAGSRFEVRIPNEILKQMGKAKGIALIASDDGKAWVLKIGPLSCGWTAEKERYPDMQRAIPASVTGESSKFDVQLLARFAKVAADLGGPRMGGHEVLIGQNGVGTALVSLPGAPDFFGALAPLRKGDKFPDAPTAAPHWAKQSPAIPANWQEVNAQVLDELA